MTWLSKECCGCAACAAVCPVGAIAMQEDAEGFLRPQIDEDICVQCRKCEKACFYRSAIKPIGEEFVQHCYAVWSTEETIRKTSQSGGVGYMLAQKVLADGGTAYGAAYTSDFSVEHVGTQTVRGIEAFRGAKYVQSRFSIIPSIKEYVSGGGTAIVFGTPCQIMGLRKALDKTDTKNIYLVDLICHGVPSPKIWAEYVQWICEKHRGEVLEAIRMRDPSFGWRTSIANFCFSGHWHSYTEYNSLFGSDLMLRESCYECRFANLARTGDLTIGDCWGIEKVSPHLDDSRGVSIVIVNTQKGKALLDSLTALHKEKIEVGQVLQAQLRHPTPMPSKRQQFWRDYHRRGIDYVIFRYAKGGWIGPIRKLLRPFKRKILEYIKPD